MNKKKTNILFQPIRRKSQKQRLTVQSRQKHSRLKFFIFIWISFAVAGYIGLVIGYNIPNNNSSTVAKASKPVKIEEPKPDIYSLWALTNVERAKRSLPALVLDERLNKSAEAKCQDMVKRDYWDHDTPDGAETWVFIKDQGVHYQSAGENLAYGFAHSSAVVQGWMNSEGHRANIIRSAYTNVGYAVCSSVNYQSKGYANVIVQHFTKL